MKRTTHLLPLLMPLLLALGTAPAQRVGAAPTGQIAFLRGDAALVAPAAGGPERRLPQSEGAWLVSASPAGGTVLFFVAPAGTKWNDAATTRGFVSRVPYAQSAPLPAPLDHAVSPQVVWSPDGKSAFISAEKLQGIYRPGGGGFRPERLPAQTASRDGRVTAWATEREIRVRGRETATTLFSIGRPEPPLAALRTASHAGHLKEMRDVPRALWGEARNWLLGPPALTPDGKTLFFATNAGMGMGASGNTAFCFVAMNLRTGKLTVLSRLGSFDGRIPDECRVSPDGQRLLFIFSQHGSAIENPRWGYIVDLKTQRAREILHNDPRHAREANLTDGASCWSPDGRYVALSVLYYSVEKTLAAADWQPRLDAFTLLLFEAATGRVVRQVPHARQASWSR